MAKKCMITGKGPMSGNKISHSNRKARTCSLPNVQKRRIWVPRFNRFVRVLLSTAALRTIDKRGADDMLGHRG